ncbi:MAG: N-6 DNA methylase [Geminicoccaceae bacterium]|nr:N-6 DNA methylase [Geminicoccaceae bacterium]
MSIPAPWRESRLPALVADLARRPGHEAVRADVTELLRNVFDSDAAAIDHEARLPEVRGRADMLLGSTVFEFKRDLRREKGDVEARLPDYLEECERRAKRRYLGIATDGATFVAYELRDGGLKEIGRHEVRRDRPDALLAWLDPALATRDELQPTAAVFRDELGRESLTFGRAEGDLARLWSRLGAEPEAALKRQLWDGLLREAYGAPVGDDGLFLQHTYLTIVAKALAHGVLGLPAKDAADLLSGRALAEAGIHGAVEGDFFDWVLADPEGADLVVRLARQVARFRLREVEADVLKAVYESLIDPLQRHDLGEYYTPDWLAQRVVATAIADPLTQTVLDPACGSGTFPFHALKRLIAAGRAAGLDDAAIVAAASRVRGLDVHPVAVIIARVTWLLALSDVIGAREGALHVPVYLGDALQWNLRDLGPTSDVTLPVPGEGPLVLPAGVVEDEARFEPMLRVMSEGLEADRPADRVRAALARDAGVAGADAAKLEATYARLLALKAAGRDGIWPFVLRNLLRPVWLSRPERRADVVVGNPPWVAYRHMSNDVREKVREACMRMNLWVGGSFTTNQDLSALFWARAVDRYLKVGGTIAFVLPYAALNRPAYKGMRQGGYGVASAEITGAWSLEETRPLFPTSAAVLFARRATPTRLPERVTKFGGRLPRRDADAAEAERHLNVQDAPWPAPATMAGASPYREKFRQGATIVPRRFFLVERLPAAGRLGINRRAPRVRGRTGPLDKAPWNGVEPPEGPVEERFLRPLLLGEHVLPYRLLDPALAVVPAEGRVLMAAEGADAAGHRHLAAWLRDAEAKWAAHAKKGTDGAPRMTLKRRIDHMRGLSLQLADKGPRVVYTGSGTRLSAAVVADPEVVIEHAAYWAPIRRVDEARYLCAVINSQTVLDRVAPMQARGSIGRRHFDNLIWELPIREYDAKNGLHREIADAGAGAERVAAAVALPGRSFTHKRRAVRDALAADGAAARIEALVGRLLGG